MKSNTLLKYLSFVLFLAQLCVAPNPAVSNKIKHIVVLMEENRSFDHMMGWFEGVNGLTGKEYNLVNASDPTSERVYVDDKALFVAPCDPNHGTPGTTFKIYASNNDSGLPEMSGFVQVEGEEGNEKTNYCEVMSSQSPSHLRILSSLSSEFVVMDRFFADYPGPTWPNRLFMLSATSAGCTETRTFYHDKPGALYPQLTFFDQITAEGLTWKNYFNDTPWELFIETIALHPENLKSMEHFYEDARTGDLPSFAWINPRAAINVTLLQGSNDQHPDHDVALGERYIKDIYEALRASPAWNDTLLIITYDEHGGFFDHVPPPTHIPPPGDNETSYPNAGVLFDRLGLRVPTLLISPWLSKNQVLSGPPDSQKPANNSEYSLSSIMATSRILLGMSSVPLTDRDAWVATFDHLFANLSEPRTDCPMHLPAPPPPAHIFEEDLPVNELQHNIMEMHASLLGVPFPTHIHRQGEVSQWLQTQFNTHASITAQWKHSKTTRTHTLISRPLSSSSSSPLQPTVTHTSSTTNSSSWNFLNSVSGYFLVSVHLREGDMCLDHTRSGGVGVSNCFPRADADASLDYQQRWVWQEEKEEEEKEKEKEEKEKEEKKKEEEEEEEEKQEKKEEGKEEEEGRRSIRPLMDLSLCLTNNIDCKGVILQRCESNKGEQKWKYLDGVIQAEDGYVLQVIENQ